MHVANEHRPLVVAFTPADAIQLARVGSVEWRVGVVSRAIGIEPGSCHHRGAQNSSPRWYTSVVESVFLRLFSSFGGPRT